MVEVLPFKGITYNKEKISKLDDVMSPPYDIISTEMQTKLYEKHRYNFVKLILGKKNPGDTEQNNRYTRAREQFESWLRKSILKTSNRNAIFPYKIKYKINNQSKTMNGFFILLKLDPDYKYIKAHERTLSKPKADRLDLIRACNANLEPIQLLYVDKKDEIRKKIDKILKDPVIDVDGYDGFNHKLWKIDDDNIISMISKKLKDKVLFIADGHHRYQTAINYADELKGEKTVYKNAPFNYRMVVLVNMFDEGLNILPTHRFIKMTGFNLNDFIEKLREYFLIEERKIDNTDKDYTDMGKFVMAEIKTEKEHKFALYCKGKYYILTLKDEKIMNDLAGDHSKTWKTLDVSILHKIILEKMIGINEKNIENHVKYTRVDSEAIQFVEEGKFDFSFLMNATKIEELKAIAEADEHMPQKSTYFLPKMLSGLVMYKM
ncbi:MAG: DUF1015 domain-containing protein [Thermoplasmatales archaeon]|nr:MAG: DUF1015 domain-containing protein [Thermoplasmatales archaeon]